MKKFCVMVGILGFGMANGMMTPTGNGALNIHQGDIGSMAVRTNVETPTTNRHEIIRYQDNFTLNGNMATISLARGDEEGDEFRVTENLTRTYPCERVFSGLQQVDNSHSIATYQLFANTNELGRIELTNAFPDNDNRYEHQRRIVGNLSYDDNALVSRGRVETYVTVEGQDHSVSTEENGSIAYRFLRTERDSQYMDAPGGGDNVRVYARWNGSEVRRDWNGLALRQKPAPAPVITQTPAPQYHQTTNSSNNGPSNIFERAGRGVAQTAGNAVGGVFRTFKKLF